jgi:hypothetical protein
MAADDTIRIRPRGPPPRRAMRVLGLFAALGLIAALALAAGLWLLWPNPRPPIAVLTATERQIDAHDAAGLTVFRFAQNPRILVLDFGSLRQQGLMLNRAAGFAEKAGEPHGRVLDDSELAKAIADAGATVETYYYGHDYSADALARFFAAADTGHVRLDAEEEWLRGLLRQEGWLAPGTRGGVISIPRAGADPVVTAAVRATILRHELSHGEFFSNPEYARYVRHFWAVALTEPERAAIRDWLASEGYDPTLEEVMLNEMQAYLMFTPNPEFFTAGAIGMSSTRLGELRRAFLRDMPPGWLRDSLAQSAPERPL